MTRIAIIGLPGSGKSTFAHKLSQKLEIPAHHLDKHIFQGKKKVSEVEFLKIKQEILDQEHWIIEGCSIKTLEMRFLRADIILYFDYPRYLCLFRLMKRVFFFDQELEASGCLRGMNWALFKYVWNFKKEKEPQIDSLRKKYPQVLFFTFKSPQEADRFFAELR